MQLSIVEALVFPQQSLANNRKLAQLHDCARTKLISSIVRGSDQEPAALFYQFYQELANCGEGAKEALSTPEEISALVESIIEKCLAEPQHAEPDCYAVHLYNFWVLVDRLDRNGQAPDGFIVGALEKIINSLPSDLVLSAEEETDGPKSLHALEVCNFRLEIKLRLAEFTDVASVAENLLYEIHDILEAPKPDLAMMEDWRREVARLARKGSRRGRARDDKRSY